MVQAKTSIEILIYHKHSVCDEQKKEKGMKDYLGTFKHLNIARAIVGDLATIVWITHQLKDMFPNIF